MHKDRECRNEVDGKHLWNQLLDSIRPVIDNEAMPAWNVVTANGDHMQVSGCDFMMIHDRVIQMWYEISLDRVKKVDGKTKPAADIKKDSLKQWQKISIGDKEGASAVVCPLNHLGQKTQISGLSTRPGLHDTIPSGKDTCRPRGGDKGNNFMHGMARPAGDLKLRHHSH